jgi:hypothetical protein
VAAGFLLVGTPLHYWSSENHTLTIAGASSSSTVLDGEQARHIMDLASAGTGAQLAEAGTVTDLGGYPFFRY